MVWTVLSMAVILASGSVPDPAPSTPGQPYAPPGRVQAAVLLLIYSYSMDAGVDESFVLIGEGLTDELKAWAFIPTSPAAGKSS